MPKGFKGTGYCSKVATPDHQFQKWGQWWSSREAWEQYRDDQNRKRRMGRVGYELNQVQKFMEMETKADDLIAERKRYDERIRVGMNVLRERHGLGRNANRTHLAALYKKTGDPDILRLLNMITTAPLNDTQKLQRIRQMFLDQQSPAEILYSTALMVGINLRKM